MDRNQDKNQERRDDRDVTVIASCSSRPQSEGDLHPTGQSTPSTGHTTASCLTFTGSCDSDVIPSDTRWADAVDMDATDATDATVIFNL